MRFVKIKGPSEVCFESLGHFVCRHRFKAALAVLALTATLGSQLHKLRIDTSNEGFFSGVTLPFLNIILSEINLPVVN